MDLPLRLTWLSSLFLVIGGGSTVTMAAAMMVVTDATPESNRSKVFFTCQAAFLVAEVIGPALGSIAMQSLGVWPPLLANLVCTCITIALAGAIPETRFLEGAKGTTQSAGETHGTWSESNSLRDSVHEMLDYMKRTLRVMCHNRNVLFLVVSFLVVDFSRQTLSILLQYVSKRYTIPIAKVRAGTFASAFSLLPRDLADMPNDQASYLLSYRAMATLITYAAILPALDFVVEKRLGLPAQKKDLQLARFSILVSALGFGILFAAPSLGFVVLGEHQARCNVQVSCLPTIS